MIADVVLKTEFWRSPRWIIYKNIGYSAMQITLAVDLHIPRYFTCISG